MNGILFVYDTMLLVSASHALVAVLHSVLLRSVSHLVCYSSG